MSSKSTMTLSLDLDNKWSYLKTHGSEKWEGFPSYFELVVPRILEFLAERNLIITFFVVGQDAALDKNHEALKSIVNAGHEIANHSFSHEPWLHLYSREDLDQELHQAEEAIERATGIKVEGFRGPGFSLSENTLEVLKARGYRYDASVFPNILNPLARAYFFATSNLTKEEKDRRKSLFGSYTNAFRPLKPYTWSLPAGPLVELPVTTMPLFKTPIHFSYLVYLASFNFTLAKLYLHTAITLCRLTRTEPSLLLHPLEFMGVEDDVDLQFFPAMHLSRARKREIMDGLFSILINRFECQPIGEYISNLENRITLKNRPPKFSEASSSANG